VAIAHNAKAFDLHFILNRAIKLKWKPELITNCLKIISMKMEHLVLVLYLSCSTTDNFERNAIGTLITVREATAGLSYSFS